jgi:Flp pilus assembly protein TadD
MSRSQLELKRYDDAFNTLRALQNDARSAEVLNALGVVQLRRGATSQTGRAVYYFSQASQVDPSDPDYFFNLGYGYWLDRDPPAAIYWLREAVRLDPADGEAHLVLAAALQQSGATAEATRERELAQRLSTNYEGSAARAASEPVPRGLERVKEFLDRPTGRVDSIITSAGQRDQTELAIHHLEAGRRAIARELDREAEQELRRALYLSPYLSEAHLLLGRVYLRVGRTADAVQAFKIALWSEETAAGHVALAEAYVAMQNLAAAKEEVARALALDPQSAEAIALRAKIGQ